MIRGVYQDGVIYPLEPVPENWVSGQKVCVDESTVDEKSGGDEIDRWLHEMQTLTADLNDRHEWARIEGALAEGDRIAKAIVQREMEVP